MHNMSAEEVTEWSLLYKTDPWGEDRDDLRIGQLGSRLYDLLHKAHFKGPHPKQTPSDWMLKFGEPEPMEGRQIMNVLKVMASQINEVNREEAAMKERQERGRKRAAEKMAALKAAEEAKKPKKKRTQRGN